MLLLAACVAVGPEAEEEAAPVDVPACELDAPYPTASPSALDAAWAEALDISSKQAFLASDIEGAYDCPLWEEQEDGSERAEGPCAVPDVVRFEGVATRREWDEDDGLRILREATYEDVVLLVGDRGWEADGAWREEWTSAGVRRTMDLSIRTAWPADSEGRWALDLEQTATSVSATGTVSVDEAAGGFTGDFCVNHRLQRDATGHLSGWLSFEGSASAFAPFEETTCAPLYVDGSPTLGIAYGGATLMACSP